MERLNRKAYDIEDFQIKSEKDADGNEAVYITGIANTKGVADAYGDIPTGKRVYDLSRYNKNPVVLADHVNSVGNIIGRMVQVKESDIGLEFRMRVMENPQTEIAKHAIGAMKQGYATALSIGGKWTYGKDLDNGQRELTKALIYEISLVGIGADGLAQTDAPRPKALNAEESHKTADLTALKALVRGMREIVTE
jgi:HK97 family phage prohead protease